MNAQESAASAANVAINRAMLRGSAWMIGMRWVVRAMGLVSTIILVRLLSPADFGIIAMAMFVVGFIEMFAESGQTLALIRHPAPTRAHLNTAWTTIVLLGLAVAAVIVAISPLAAVYFQEPETKTVLQFLALRAAIGGFENIGLMYFRKNLDFKREFWVGILQKMIPVIVTILLAIYLRNYWALALGIVIGRLLGVILSYCVHPYRPRFSLEKVRELFSFSAWMVVVHVSQYFGGKSDEFVIGGFAGAAAMGNYNVAADLAASPTYELVAPTARALFPIYASIATEPQRLKDAFFNVLSTVLMISCATGLGVALVAQDLVAVLLGDKWLAAVPLIQWLAVAWAINAVSGSAFGVFQATGWASISAYINVANAVCTYLTFLALALIYLDPVVIAAGRFAVTLAFVVPMFLCLKKVFPLRLRELVRLTRSPLLAGCAMVIVVRGCHEFMPFESTPRLALEVSLGAASYLSVLFSLRFVFGETSFEKTILSHYKKIGGRLCKRKA